jgi:toxin ParE1/3/4
MCRSVRIRYLPRAFAELEAINSYLVNRNPQAALLVTEAIKNSIFSLGGFPEMGQLTDEEHVRILRSAHHAYNIYYSIVGDEVQILHIRHVARRPPAAGEL